jgi:hypothetical protein
MAKRLGSMVVKAVGQFTRMVAGRLAHLAMVAGLVAHLAYAGAGETRFFVCPDGVDSESIRASTHSIEIAVESQPDRAIIWEVKRKDDSTVAIEEKAYQVGSSKLGARGFQVFALEAPSGTIAVLELTKLNPIPPGQVFRNCSVTITWPSP